MNWSEVNGRSNQSPKIRPATLAGIVRFSLTKRYCQRYIGEWLTNAPATAMNEDGGGTFSRTLDVQSVADGASSACQNRSHTSLMSIDPDLKITIWHAVISYCYWNCCCVYISRRMVNCIVSDLGRVHLSESVEHVRWRGREARGKNDNGILRVTAPTVLSGFQDSFNADSLLNLQWRSSWRSHHNGSNTVYITHRELSLASRQRCAR